jgi:hypothetical protein
MVVFDAVLSRVGVVQIYVTLFLDNGLVPVHSADLTQIFQLITKALFLLEHRLGQLFPKHQVFALLLEEFGELAQLVG